MSVKKILKCKLCFSVFYETDNILSPAGVSKGRMMYNTRCPGCGKYDCMNADLVGVPDEVLDKLSNQEVSYSEALNKKNDETLKKDKDKAKYPSEF